MKNKTVAVKDRRCMECGSGILMTVREFFTTRTSEGLEITVPDVPLDRCAACGDTTLSAESAAMIDDFIERVTGRLSREELQTFLEQYQLTQKEAEQILGLGEKMIGRWLKGPARVSASMGNYIRLLMADPKAFETLKLRRWVTIPACAVAEIPANYPAKSKTKRLSS